MWPVSISILDCEVKTCVIRETFNMEFYFTHNVFYKQKKKTVDLRSTSLFMTWQQGQITRCLPSWRKCGNIETVICPYACWIKFCNEPWCHTLSNALLILKNSNLVPWPSSEALQNVLYFAIKWLVVESSEHLEKSIASHIVEIA